MLAVVSGAAALSRDEAAQRKAFLSARLDSLEMLKQQRKQRGEPLAELEHACRGVRDSIEALRKEVASLAESGLLPPPDRSANVSSPVDRLRTWAGARSTFDWAIAGLGALVLIAGLVLMMGIARTVSRGSRRRRPKNRTVAPAKPRLSSNPPPASVPPDTADIDNDGLESLRKRVGEDIRRIQRFDSERPEGLKTVAASDAVTGAGEGHTLRERILDAALEGLDVQQISKRFHISIDQVALILRVARGEKRDS